jgi:hypothetical protein
MLSCVPYVTAMVKINSIIHSELFCDYSHSVWVKGANRFALSNLSELRVTGKQENC